MQIILASSSITRKKILESLGLKFKVVPSHIDETKISATNPKLLVQKIAKAKAEEVKEKLGGLVDGSLVNVKSSKPPIFLILAADSMVVLGKTTIGKPKDKQDAKKILKALSGRTHEFITGLYIINTKTKKTWQKLAVSKVTFRRLKEAEIDAYINKTDVTRYAGGYSIIPPEDFLLLAQNNKERKACLKTIAIKNLKSKKIQKNNVIAKIQGSLTNVMGLPLEILLPILKESGFK